MSQLGNFVWGIADQIRGVYKPAQYGSVALRNQLINASVCSLNLSKRLVSCVFDELGQRSSVLP